VCTCIHRGESSYVLIGARSRVGDMHGPSIYIIFPFLSNSQLLFYIKNETKFADAVYYGILF
jgi:hypothetical protein